MATALDFKALLVQHRARHKNKDVGSFDFYGKPPNITNLEDYRVLPSLNAAYYIPEFISVEDERRLIDKIYSDSSGVRWTQLTQRRLCLLGGIPSMSGTRKEPLPAWVERFVDYMVSAGIPQPKERYNHVLLNEYSKGMGIAPHFDSSLYLPLVAVLSLQSPAMFHFYKPTVGLDSEADKIVGSIYIEPRSLLLFSDTLYNEFKHGIPSAMADRIPLDVANAHLLRIYRPGELVSRSGERTDSLTHTENQLEFPPRLSLTLRELASTLDNSETIETPANKDEILRTAANYYRSVSEPV